MSTLGTFSNNIRHAEAIITQLERDYIVIKGHNDTLDKRVTGLTGDLALREGRITELIKERDELRARLQLYTGKPPLKIENGKRYLTQGGRVTLPIYASTLDSRYPYTVALVGDGSTSPYTVTAYGLEHTGSTGGRDLVSEHIEPARCNGAPEGLEPYPPVPEGYDHWEYRGKFWNASTKHYAHTMSDGKTWMTATTCTLGGDCHYIEAVK